MFIWFLSYCYCLLFKLLKFGGNDETGSWRFYGELEFCREFYLYPGLGVNFEVDPCFSMNYYIPLRLKLRFYLGLFIHKSLESFGFSFIEAIFVDWSCSGSLIWLEEGVAKF